LPSSCFTCPGKERKEVVSSTVFRVGMTSVEESKRNDENRKVWRRFDDSFDVVLSPFFPRKIDFDLDLLNL
jgi:hypothetical protein